MIEEDAPDSAFGFTATWQDYAPIAFTNLALTIVTLGIYRFWATTRTRRYLWGNTHFIGTPLEWTGTGVELLIGFILALVFFGVPLLFFQFGLQAMILQGHGAAAGITALILYVALISLVGIARFRGLRYRLSRTWWRGIRGGSDDQGVAYGWRYLWKSIAGTLAAGLLIPWSMTQLWNDRWNRMSFGTRPFGSISAQGPIMGRYLLFYLVPILLFVGALVLGATASSTPGQLPRSSLAAISLMVVLVLYVALPLVALIFYAAFFRNAVDGMDWAGLNFSFDARTKDWFKLFFGSIGLVIVTLGIGAIFLQYRNWSFFVRHIHAFGEIDLAALGQSTTAEPRQGEGLLDAFDIGAI